MGRRVLRRLIWDYSVCLCPMKGTPGLNELILVLNMVTQQLHIPWNREGYSLSLPCDL